MVRPAVRRGRSEGAGQSTRLIHSRKMRGATRSKAAHLQVVLATDLTAVLRGNAAGHAGGEILRAENRAARAHVAAGQASIRLHTIGRDRSLVAGSHSHWAIRVLKHLVFQVHLDEHPVGTGVEAKAAETCAEGRRWHCTT